VQRVLTLGWREGRERILTATSFPDSLPPPPSHECPHENAAAAASAVDAVESEDTMHGWPRGGLEGWGLWRAGEFGCRTIEDPAPRCLTDCEGEMPCIPAVHRLVVRFAGLAIVQ
jgi:hypothetical protein